MSRIARDASKDDTDPEVSGPSGGRESRVAALKARSTLAEIIAFARGQIVGEVIDDRLAGRDFEPGDVGVRNARGMLYERAQAVSVRRDQPRQARRDLGAERGA